MNRFFASFPVVATLAAGVTAQCGSTAGGTAITLFATSTESVADEGLSAPIALGFAFPMGPGTYTHMQVESNGVLYLTNGAPVVGATGFGNFDFCGAPGDAPRVAPYWDDLDGANAPAAWAITVDNSLPGRVAVNWKNVNEYLETTVKSFQAVLLASGVIEFSYPDGQMVADDGVCAAGISAGGGITDPGSSDLSLGANVTSAIVYQRWLGAGVFDLAGTTIQFTPNGVGGYVVATTCSLRTAVAASNTVVGSGCYTFSDSIYESFADATSAAAALAGNSLLFTPLFDGRYLATWSSGGAASYVPPSGSATDLLLSDDDEVVVAPTAPFPTAGGPMTTLRVHANGVVSWGAGSQTFPGTIPYVPAPAALLAAANEGVWSWHDYNTTETGSGAILYEEVGGLACVTWDGVENYATPEIVNPGRMQMQLDLVTGTVNVIWVTVDANDTSPFGSNHLVGYSAAGASTDGGSVSLAATLPRTTSLANIEALSLAAAPAPISTPVSGSIVTYTTSHIPEAAPGSGVHLGILILSFQGVPYPGLDLTPLGAAGCSFHVGSLDVLIGMVGPTDSQGVAVTIPAGMPSGTQFFAQTAAYDPAANAFGWITSNGVASLVSSF